MRKTASEIVQMSAKNKAAWYRPGKPFPEAPENTPKTRQKAPQRVRDKFPTEHEEQEQVIAWWASRCEAYGYLPEVLMAIPNGAHKSFGQAAKFRREGLRAGAPDLFLAVQQRSLGGLFLELKRSNWKPPREAVGSKAHDKYMTQKCFHEMLQEQNYRVVFCAGHNAAIDELKAYLISKRIDS